MKAQFYSILCVVLLMFLVSFCIEPTPNPEPITDTTNPPPADTITTPTVPTIDYKLIDYYNLDSLPSHSLDTLFGTDVIQVVARLKNFTDNSEIIDYSQVEIKQTEGTGGTMIIKNEGTYLELNFSIDKITNPSVAFGYDVYYKGKKTQHLSHELFQSWIGYTLHVMYDTEGNNTKAVIKPGEQYITYYSTLEIYRLYRTESNGSTPVSPITVQSLDILEQKQLEPGEYPEFFVQTVDDTKSKVIKYPINLTVDGIIFDIWKGFIVRMQHIDGRKAKIKIYPSEKEWSYSFVYDELYDGHSLIKWDGIAIRDWRPPILEQYCATTKSRVKHIGTIALAEYGGPAGRPPLPQGINLWWKDGNYYLTSGYDPCGEPADSPVRLSLESPLLP